MADVSEIENLDELVKDTIIGKVVEQKVSTLLPPGENYASILYKVDFKVKNGEKIEEFHAVAKCSPPNSLVQELSNTPVTFKIEIAWYTKVIPTLIQFQQDQGIEKPIDFFQKIYGSRISLDPTSDTVDLNAVILSDNLKYLGYRNVDRMGFVLFTTRAILTNLATFHTVSLAIRYHSPDLFNTNIKPYLTAWTSDKALDTMMMKAVWKIYQHIPDFEPLMDRIRKTLNESNIYQVRSIREPWATAIHMDLWSNNIMVTDDKNPKIVILDLQCPGFASLAADVAFFLLTSVTHDIISDQFDSLLKFYHKEFIRNLEELNVPTEKFSFESFLSEFNTEVKIGELGHALTHMAVVLSECDTADDSFMALIGSKTVVNDKHIRKFKWITSKAEKRNWI